MSVKGQPFTSSLASVPEIAPRGALIKIAYAGAHLKRATASMASDLCMWGGGSSGPHSDMNNNSPMKYNQNLVRVWQRRMKRRRANSLTNSSDRVLSSLNDKLTHKYELTGVVQMLGEEVEDDINVTVGDKVIIYPFKGMADKYSDYVCVPDVSHLIHVPDDMPLSNAAGLITGALNAFKLAYDLREHCNTISQEIGQNPRILMIGSKPLLLWTLSFLAHIYEEERPLHKIIVASDEENFLPDGIKSVFKGVSFVQWNRDAYEQVLVERTLGAVGRQKADVLVNLEAYMKQVSIAIKCLKNGGRVFVPDCVTAPRGRGKCDLKTSDGFDIFVSESGNCETFQKVFELVRNNKVQIPIREHLSLDDPLKVSSVMENQGISLIKVSDFQDT